MLILLDLIQTWMTNGQLIFIFWGKRNSAIYIIFIVFKQMDKLVKAIKQHYQQEQNKEVGVKVAWPRVQSSPVPCIMWRPLHPQSLTLFTSLPHRYASKGTEEKAATDGGSQEIAEPASEVNVFSRAVFVNTRRGKGPGAKRKISGAAAVIDAAQVRSCRWGGRALMFVFPSKINALLLHAGWRWGGCDRWAKGNQEEKDWRVGRRPDSDYRQPGWQER